MADVRLDANGVAKGTVFEQTVGVVHRAGVTGADEDDPDPEDAVASLGYACVDFDVDVALGGTLPMVEVAASFYDATADLWFRGESAFFTASGRYRLRVEARGAPVFLSVVALTGTSPTLELDVWAMLS